MAARPSTSPSTRRTIAADSTRRFIQITATFGLFVSLLVILGTQNAMSDADVQGMGLAHPVPAFGHPGGHLVLHPRAHGGVAALRQAEGRGEDVDGADRRQLRQRRAMEGLLHRAARRDGGAGGGLVHGPVLRALLPADDSQGAARHRLQDRRARAAARNAVLRRVRRAVRPRSGASGSSWPAACSRR